MLRETVVTVEPVTYDLISLVDYKADWNIAGTSEDTFISRKISAMSYWVMNECGRIFNQHTVEITCKLRDTNEQQYYDFSVEKLFIGRKPIISVSSVVEDDILLDSGLYKINASEGYLLRKDENGKFINWTANYVVITAEIGFSSIPVDLQDAVSRLVNNRQILASTEAGIRSIEVVGVETRTYFNSNASVSDEGINEVLAKYRICPF